MNTLLARTVLLAVLSLASAQQPDVRDSAWIEAPAQAERQLRMQASERKRPEASLLSVSQGASLGAGAATSMKIMRELGVAERKVGELMRGHPQELMKEERLLHQASQMALRSGELSTKMAMLQSSRKALQKSESREAAASTAAEMQRLRATVAQETKEIQQQRATATATMAASAKELGGFASKESVLEHSEEAILGEAAKAKGEVASALSGQKKAEVMALMDKLESAQQSIVSSEKHGLAETRAELSNLQQETHLAHQAAPPSLAQEERHVVVPQLAQPKHSAWMHAASLAEMELQQPDRKPVAALLSESGSASLGAAEGMSVKIMHELGLAERKVGEVMRGHPHELMKEEGLLHQASQAILRAGEARTHEALIKSRTAALMQAEKESASAKSLLSKETASVEQTLASVKAETQELQQQGASAKAAAAAEAKALGGIASQESKEEAAEAALLSEAAKAKGEVASALTGKDRKVASQVMALMDKLQSEQQNIVSSEKHGLTVTKATLRTLEGARDIHKAQPSLAQVAQEARRAAMEGQAGLAKLAREGIAHEKRYVHQEMALAQGGRRIVGEMQEAVGAVAGSMGKENPAGAAEVEQLLEEAQHRQEEVLRSEDGAVKASPERLRRLAALERSAKQPLV